MEDLKILFKRFYTKELENSKTKTVYDLFKWKKVDVKIIDHKTGEVLTDMKNLEFPYNYSQNACDIIASKYFRKSGIPNECGYENSMKMVAHRLAFFWCESLKDEKIIKTEAEAAIFYDEIVYAFLNQMYAPNSPQWFNTGLSLVYGIKGEPQGHFYYDTNQKKVLPCSDSYTRTQASACFIISIEDKLLGPHSISEQYVTETKLFKGGSGTGTNFSTIRAKGEKLSGGGVSSGLMSFLKGLDRNAGAIKSGGTTRRAAKMLCLNVDHPEIVDYITWKAKEEDKVKALGKMGYDASFEGEAYETVSGQNANNSVMLSDEFMKKVLNLKNNPDETIELKGRIDSSVNKIEKISNIWNALNKSSFRCADPSPLFSDRLNAWHTCPCGEDGKLDASYNKINSTNPCGEYAFLDDTSCNLASINIYKFYDSENKTFDLEGYKHIIGLVQLILEASIHWGQFPTEDVARKTHLFRTTGLGISNLAALLMVMGYPYDSDNARAVSSSLIGILTGYSYYISSLMSKEVGSFEKYDINKKYMLRILRNSARAAGSITSPFESLNYEPLKVNHSVLSKENLDYIGYELKKTWNLTLEAGEKYGFRNAQVSVMAPTGTISFAMDCASTSVEPFFSHVIYKKLSGGGYMTLTNPLIEESLKNLGYSENEIKDITAYILRKKTITNKDGSRYDTILDGKIEGAPHLKKEHLAIFDTANKCGKGERFISPMGHILMVASIIPLISGSVSKTVNLPKDASIDDFKNIIIDSWKFGVKGITLYRDSSKESQPLNTSLSEDSATSPEDMTYSQLLNIVKDSTPQKYMKRERAVGIRNGKTHPAQIGGIKIYTTVNRRDNGEMSEVYITTDREGTLIMGLLNSLSKSISVMLQYHVPPKDISEMLRGQKYEPYGFVQKHPYIKYVTSISDLISKIIDIELNDFTRCQVKPEDFKYIKPELLTREDNPKVERRYDITCPNCSSTRMTQNGTCYVCLDCGTTTGCS